MVAWTAPTPVTGTGAWKDKKIAVAGTGTYTPPVTGTGAVSLPGAPSIVLAGSGIYTPPVTGTGGLAAKKPALAGSGTYTGPYSGTGGLTAKKPALAGTGTYTPQPVTGTGAIARQEASAGGPGHLHAAADRPAPGPCTPRSQRWPGTGTYTPAIDRHRGLARQEDRPGRDRRRDRAHHRHRGLAAKKIALAGTGIYTVMGAGTFAAKKAALAATGLYTPPGTGGTGTFTAKKITLAGTGVLTPAVTGTGTFTAKKITLAGTGVSNIAPTTGLASWHAKKIQPGRVPAPSAPLRPGPRHRLSAAPPPDAGHLGWPGPQRGRAGRRHVPDRVPTSTAGTAHPRW